MALRHFRYSALMGQIWMGLHVPGMQKRCQRHNCRRRFAMTAASGSKTRIQCDRRALEYTFRVPCFMIAMAASFEFDV